MAGSSWPSIVVVGYSETGRVMSEAMYSRFWTTKSVHVLLARSIARAEMIRLTFVSSSIAFSVSSELKSLSSMFW